MRDLPLLTLTTFFPLVGAGIVAMIPRDSQKLIRVVTLLATLVTFAFSLLVLGEFRVGKGDFQMVERYDWVRSAGAYYHLGVDGISLWMLLLTTFLLPISVVASWTVEKRVKAFHLVLLILETGIIGVFLALDLLLFYVFWEAMLIPMYLLIGVWGYSRRVYAAIKFFLYTLSASLLMLAGIVALYFVGGRTFDITGLARAGLPEKAQLWLFLAFFISFAVKVPIFPFHTWLPDAHTEAPTAGSVILAGVLLKMGAYGFLRFSIPLFPDASRDFAPWLALLGVIGIVYGGLISIVQKDIKRLVAYSSVSHLGFVVLGISSLSLVGTSGSVLQMLNHGLSTGMLFLMIGMLYQRAHTRQIQDFGGVNQLMPVFGGLFLIATLASLGLPGLNGFIGEFLILIGAFDVFRVLSIVATVGVLLAAIYLLWAYERVFTGPSKVSGRPWRDISLRELATVVPIVVLMIGIGVYPRPFLDRIEPSVDLMLQQISTPIEKLAQR